MHIQGAAAASSDRTSTARVTPRPDSSDPNAETFDQLLNAATAEATPPVARVETESISMQERLTPAFLSVARYLNQ
jgi:hypothetical protein